MTYCLAIATGAGLVFGSDSRTNAGVDYVTRYSKMHVFTPDPDRLFVVLSAGNLATTQEVLNVVARDLDATDGRECLRTCAYLFEVADYLGRVSVAAQQHHQAALAAGGIDGSTTLIVGGQIRGQAPGLFLVYPQGNTIAASPETPYLQIGESKYGKPMLDRIGDGLTSLEDAARLALVSLDATMRSNVTVGPPFEIAIYRADAFQIGQRLKIEAHSPYYEQFRDTWQQGLEEVFSRLPRFDWETP